MDYQKTFQKLLKQMNDKKFNWDEKQSWETDIEQGINEIDCIKSLNTFLKNEPLSSKENNVETSSNINQV